MIGTLRRNTNNRWEIYGNTDDPTMDLRTHELTSGSVVEVKIGDHWIMTSIEYTSDYYAMTESLASNYHATTHGIVLTGGLRARIPGTADDDGPTVPLTINLSRRELTLLAVLGNPADVLNQLIDHAQQGVYRPGAWERGWLCQAFGEDWIGKMERNPELPMFDRPKGTT